jgi:hypothetical protein
MTADNSPLAPATSTTDALTGRFRPAGAREASPAFLAAAGSLAAGVSLVLLEDLLGLALFPGAIVALALTGIAAAAGLGGIRAGHRRDGRRQGRVATLFVGLTAASGALLAMLVPVGLATGGLTGDAPPVVDRLAALAMLGLVLGMFVALLSVGISSWRSGFPSRGVGRALVGAALLVVAALALPVTGGWVQQLLGIGLHATAVMVLGGVGLALRAEARR